MFFCGVLLSFLLSSSLLMAQKKNVFSPKDVLPKKEYYIAVPDSLWPMMEQISVHRSIKKRLIPVDQYGLIAERIVTCLENNGYPFAEVSLVPHYGSDDTIASLQIVKNKYITFDSVVVKGDVKLRNAFLLPFLDWHPHKKYDERVAAQISSRTHSLAFATETSPAGIEFVGDKAYLYLFLQRQKVNQFDAYLGLVPVSEKTGKTMITGEVNLHLQNIFAIGETFDLQWKAPARYSQYLFLQADFPYLFRLPLGVKGTFLLDKKDTNYLNVNYLLALKYSFNGTNYLQVYFDQLNSRVLSSSLNHQLPQDSLLGNYRQSMYGIELVYRKLDNFIQPRKGFSLLFNLSAGQRKMVSNTIENESVYADVPLQQISYRAMSDIWGYFAWGKRWGAVFRLNGAWRSGRAALFNELLKFGGATTLQGFDELSLSASAYALAMAELRFWYAQYSYINVFMNGAWYERKMTQSYFADFPFGFGLGITLYTKAGVFYLNYALGQQKNSPLSFKTGKIHFGMKVQF